MKTMNHRAKNNNLCKSLRPVIANAKAGWTAYDARFFNIKMPENIPMTEQGRAYTSPIWYTPK